MQNARERLTEFRALSALRSQRAHSQPLESTKYTVSTGSLLVHDIKAFHRGCWLRVFHCDALVMRHEHIHIFGYSLHHTLPRGTHLYLGRVRRHEAVARRRQAKVLCAACAVTFCIRHQTRVVRALVAGAAMSALANTKLALRRERARAPANEPLRPVLDALAAMQLEAFAASHADAVLLAATTAGTQALARAAPAAKADLARAVHIQ